MIYNAINVKTHFSGGSLISNLYLELGVVSILLYLDALGILPSRLQKKVLNK